MFLSDTTWNYLGKCIFSNSVICSDLVPVHVPALTPQAEPFVSNEWLCGNRVNFLLSMRKVSL